MKYLLFIVILLFSCDGKPDLDVIPEPPKDLIEQEKFTEVMVDIHLIEATLKLKLIRSKDIRSRTPGYYDQIFEKHNISEEQFTSSLDFYAKQRPLIKEVFDSVEVKLIELKSQVDIHEKKSLRDSISDELPLNEVDTLNL